jgi:two-component SAPR family response regulator
MFKTQKQKISEVVHGMISNTPYTQDFREKVIRALTGDYTEEDILEEERQQREFLEQLEKEFDYKYCIQAEESQVFEGSAQEVMSRINIDELDKTASSRQQLCSTNTGHENP